MQHHGGLFGAVGVHVGQLELGRQAEVQLAGGQGVLGTHGGLDVHVQLGAVEGGLADLLGKVDAQVGQHLAQGGLGVLPHGVVVMVFLLVGRVPQRQHAAVVGDVEVLVHVKDQVADVGDLALDLVGRDEQVGVVLAEMPAALDALQRAAGLVAEIVGDLADADGQLTVAVGAVGVDHHVMGAVHRAQHVAFALHLHGGEHVLAVMVPVAAGLVQVDGAHAGGHDVLVAAGALLLLDIVLQLLPDGVAVGQKHRQAAAHQVVGHKQPHLLADLAVIALAGFLLLLLPGVQLLLVVEGHAVDAGQHLVVLVVLPVSARLLGDLEGFQRLGVGQVGPDAHVDVLALLVEAELGLVGQVGHVLDLVVLAALLHQLDGLVAGQDEGLDGKVFLADLLHLFFNAGQILVGQLGVAQVHIVVEAVLGGGAKGKVRLGEQPLDGLRHDVGGRVAQYVQFLFLRALGHGAVLVDDLHKMAPPFGVAPGLARQGVRGGPYAAPPQKKTAPSRCFSAPEDVPAQTRDEAAIAVQVSSTVPPELHAGKAARHSFPAVTGRARRGFAPALRGGKAQPPGRPLAAPCRQGRRSLIPGRSAPVCPRHSFQTE